MITTSAPSSASVSASAPTSTSSCLRPAGTWALKLHAQPRACSKEKYLTAPRGCARYRCKWRPSNHPASFVLANGQRCREAPASDAPRASRRQRSGPKLARAARPASSAVFLMANDEGIHLHMSITRMVSRNVSLLLIELTFALKLMTSAPRRFAATERRACAGFKERVDDGLAV